jgi:hypothetical protein
MLGIVDPGNNYAFDMHQYMDSDGSGTHSTINNNDPQTGVSRLTAATQWLQNNHLRGFLGEFAVDNSIINPSNPSDPSTLGNEVLNNMLTYMKQNSSVWLGWTFWGGGPWWSSNSMFHIDPVSGQDQNVMPVLQQYFAVAPKPGDFTRDGVVNASDLQKMLEALSDLSDYQATNNLSDTQLKMIADVNGDNVVNNSDIQAMLHLLITGVSPAAPVPEPTSLVLMALTFAWLLPNFTLKSLKKNACTPVDMR